MLWIVHLTFLLCLRLRTLFSVLSFRVKVGLVSFATERLDIRALVESEELAGEETSGTSSILTIIVSDGFRSVQCIRVELVVKFGS